MELFRRLDRDLWEKTGHNPVLLLGTIEQAKLEEAANDDAFLAHLRRVESNLETYLAGDSTWFRRTYAKSGDVPLIAYFSAEFGLTECLSIFAGGLGILAGDHLKSASDLGVPLVGVGLLYQQGYFRQYLSQSGWQQEAYVGQRLSQSAGQSWSITRTGSPVMVEVDLAGQPVYAQVWRVQVGRVPLYLLDTNIPSNARPEDRDITDQLYGGDREMRIRQEILLGIGGYRALQAIGSAAHGLPHERRPLCVSCAGTHLAPDENSRSQPARKRASWLPPAWFSPPTRRSKPATTTFMPI